MEIVAFIHDAESLKRFTDHYGLDTCSVQKPSSRFRS